MSVLSRASVRYLAHHPAQLALSVLGIALGVAVVVGIELASHSAQRAFELSSRELAGAATHVLRGGRAGVPEQLYAALRRDPSAPPMAPVVERTVVLVDEGGTALRTLELLGVDPLAEGPFRSLPERSSGTDAVELLRQPAGVLMAAGTASELGLRAGDALPLRVDSRLVEARLADVLLPASDLERRSTEALLVADIATAQVLTGELGRLTRVDLQLPTDADGRARVEAWLGARLPDGVTLEPASRSAQSLAGMTAAFQTNLRALGLLALFVGVFLVYNTVTFSVVQRRALWASLRTLGVTRRQVFRLVCGEALALGAVGTLLGLGLGALLGSGLVQLVARTINDLYFAVQVSGLTLDGGVLARGALLGLGGTLLGALPPALEATAQAPRTAQVRSTLESRARVLVPRLALAGVAVALLALGLLAVTRDSLAASFAALFALLLAAAFLAPAFTVGTCALASRALGRLTGSVGRMAARGVVRNLSRNAVAIAALSIAIAASIGMGIMIASFRGAVSRWLTISLVADVYVSAPNPVSSRNTSDLPPGLVARFLARPEVVGGTTYRGFETTDGSGRTVFGAALGMDLRSRAAFAFAPGRRDDVWERFEAGAAIVSEPFARRTGLGVGDEAVLLGDRGLERFPIAGVYYDYTSDQGFVQVSRATYERCFEDRGVSSLALFLAPGADPQAAAEALRADLLPGEVPRIRSTATLRAASLEVFDRTFRVTSVLRLLAGAIAFVGTLSALLALQMERTRELGVLRALGLTPRQVRRLVLSETGLMGAIAGLLALPLGVVLAWVLIEHINTRAFGWTLWMQVHPGVLLQGLGLAVLAALLAGIVPAWRMARTTPAAALRSE